MMSKHTLSDWSFDVEEVSAGVYQVTGTDKYGRRIEEKGTDPDKLLIECQRAASRLLSHDGDHNK